jgi:hypothetical protein
MEAPNTQYERVALWCGCEMAVLRRAGPQGGVQRAIARKHIRCRLRAHRVGERVYLWDLLPPLRNSQWPR